MDIYERSVTLHASRRHGAGDMYLYLRYSLLNELMAPKPTFSVICGLMFLILRVMKEGAEEAGKTMNMQFSFMTCTPLQKYLQHSSCWKTPVFSEG